MPELLTNNTSARNSLYHGGDYHMLAASTDPYIIDSSHSQFTRWSGGDRSSNPSNGAANHSKVFVGRITTRGHHNQVTVTVTPNSITGVYAIHSTGHPVKGLSALKYDVRPRSSYHLIALQPDRVTEQVFVSPKEVILGIQLSGFSRVQGPSPFEGLTGNTVVQDIEDVSISKGFIHKFGKCIGKIYSLSSRPKGWDSYGAIPAQGKAIENSLEFLKMLYKKRKEIPCPVVGSSPTGEITCQWLSPVKEVFVQIGISEFSYYLARPDHDQVDEEDTITSLNELEDRVLSHLL